MSEQKKTPADKAGAKGQQEDAGMTTHEQNHAVRPRPSRCADSAFRILRAVYNRGMRE